MRSFLIGIFSIHTLLWLSVIISTVESSGGSDPQVSITETDPPTKAGFRSIVKIPQNRDAHFTCVVKNKPVNKVVYWIKESNASKIPVEISADTETTDPFKYHIDKPSPLAWRLKIQNVLISDEGSYTCRVLMTNQIYKRDSKEIVVTEIPQISDLDTSSDESVVEGMPLKLSCAATGRPVPAIKWTKMAGGLLPEGGRELRNNILEVRQASPQDRGRYKCEANNEAGSDSRLIDLVVRFFPRVKPDQSVVRQKVGYLKELVCNIEGYPLPEDGQISWSKNGLPVVVNNDYKITYLKGASSRKMSKLTIRNVQLSDFGQYTCSATNIHGSSKTTMELMESEEPTPDRTGTIRSGAAYLSFSFVTCVMLVSVCFLHIF